MNFSDDLACDATALAQHVAQADTTTGELLDIALAQHPRVHGRLNAYARCSSRRPARRRRGQ